MQPGDDEPSEVMLTMKGHPMGTPNVQTKREQEFSRQREALEFFERLSLSGAEYCALAARVAPTYFRTPADDIDDPEAMREIAVRTMVMQSLYGNYFSKEHMAASAITEGYAVWDVKA